MRTNLRLLALGSFLVACSSPSSESGVTPRGQSVPPGSPAVSSDAPGAAASGSSDPAASGDAGTAADGDSASTVSVATLGSQMPQVTSSGGPVLANPKTVLLSFPGDPIATSMDPFAASLASDPYWKVATSEYGVGPLTVLSPVHLHRSAPSSVSDAEIQSILTTALANPVNNFGPPDPSTIYALLIPYGTAVTGANGGSACGAGGFAGYHGAFALPDGTVIPYAVIVECKLGVSKAGTLTHELAEAVTDPFIHTTPAFNRVGSHDLGFRIGHTRGTEVGDMCEGVNGTVDDGAEKVARIWSNAAARTGHNPCVPAPAGEAFFIALPTSVPDTVQATLPNGESMAGSGFALAAGQSRTIELGLMSDGTSAPWSVSVHEVDPSVKGGAGVPTTTRLTFSLDKTTGVAGDRMMLTVTAVADTTGGAPFAIVSELNGEKREWFGIVGAP